MHLFILTLLYVLNICSLFILSAWPRKGFISDNMLTKVCSIKAMFFPSIHVQMWELDHKEDWVLKNWFFWSVVLEKTLESPLDWRLKEIKAVNPERNQPWIFTGRTDTEAEAPIFYHLMWRADSLGKTLMLAKTEGKRRRGWQRMRWLDSITDPMDMNLNKLWEIGRTEELGVLQVTGSQRVGHDLVAEQQHQMILELGFKRWRIP